MHHGQAAVSELRDAAYVAGGDEIGLGRDQRLQLASAQAAGDFGLHDIVCAGGTAAEMSVTRFHDAKAGGLEQRLGFARHALAVLQAAG